MKSHPSDIAEFVQFHDAKFALQFINQIGDRVISVNTDSANMDHIVIWYWAKNESLCNNMEITH